MVSQISQSIVARGRAFDNFKQPQDGYYLNAPINNKKDENNHKIGKAITASALVVGFGTLALFSGGLNKKAGKLIESETLMAACQDSLNDSIMTFTTLASLVFYKLTNINVDALIGLIVSVFILKSGIEIFSNVMSTILGKAPDRELIKEIEDTIMAHKEIHGIHDLMLHDYGLTQRFLTLHAEVDCHCNIMDMHDEIDNIEREILNKFNITTTIHMDPVDFEDETVIKLQPKVKEIVKKINPEYNIHDFRIVKGNTHTNVVFDCVIPSDDHISHEKLASTIEQEINKLDGGPYYAVVEVEHSYV